MLVAIYKSYVRMIFHLKVYGKLIKNVLHACYYLEFVTVVGCILKKAL